MQARELGALFVKPSAGAARSSVAVYIFSLRRRASSDSSQIAHKIVAFKITDAACSAGWPAGRCGL